MSTSTTTSISQIGTVIVPITDQDRAIEFYTEKLGFEKRADIPMGEQYRWVEVAPAGAQTSVAIVLPRPGDTAGGKDTGVAFSCSDLAADHAALKAAGVDVDEEISKMGGPVPDMFWLRDPDGNVLLAVQAA
jgi:catechol 2,3-dioxygenase-like lactoylglutathione lyase family enzyme